jgi:hypothetical protein
MKPRKTFLLRIEPALYSELEAWAEQELRSVNGQIEYLLKQAVRKRKPALPAPPDIPAQEGEPGGSDLAPS